jgi:hypothetical protein
MRPANMDERARLDGLSSPYARIFAYLRENPGWAHLDLSDLPFSIDGLKEKKQALLDEAGVQGLVLQVEEGAGNPGGGLFVRLLHSSG